MLAGLPGSANRIGFILLRRGGGEREGKRERERKGEIRLRLFSGTRYSILDETVLPFPFYLLLRDSFHTNRVTAVEVTKLQKKGIGK
jgi:hypothetical protein